MAFFKFGSLIESFTGVTTSNSTTTLSNNDSTAFIFSGTNDHTVRLPDATTCFSAQGQGSQKFYIVNNSTGVITVQTNDTAILTKLAPDQDAVFWLTNKSTAAGVWRIQSHAGSQPLKFYANNTQSINIAAGSVPNIDGTDTNAPPISSLIPTVPLSTHNLQTGATTGATFLDAALPTSTVGYFRRVGYTLLASGEIQVLFTPEASTLNAVANPGTVFVKSGLPIGWIDLVAHSTTEYKTAGSGSLVIQNSVNGVSYVHRFGSGGGGGGSGDASSILETVKNHFVDSLYEYVTPNVFSADQDDYLHNTSTATFDIANEYMKFSNAAETVIITDAIDDAYRADERVINDVSLLAFWNPTGIDTAATYEVSRDSGVNWSAVTMDRVGTTELYKGQKVFARESSLTTLATGVGSTPAELNATTQSKISSQFTLAADRVGMRVQLSVTKTGTPSGYLYVSIVADDGTVDNKPSTSPSDILVRSNPIAVSGITSGLTVDLSDVYLPAGIYHVVLESDAAYKSSFVTGTTKINVLQGIVSSGNNGGFYNSGTQVWSETFNAGFNVYGIEQQLMLKVTSSAGSKYLDALSVFYGAAPAVAISGSKNLQVFKFSGDLNTTDFVITNFSVDPDVLKVYDVQSGQVYRYGAFEVLGNTVRFATGQFSDPGNTITLIFDQTEGGGFDNSDQNAALLAANFLGSTDATIDKSQAGRGIFLRRPDGTLREITIDNSDNIVVYSV